MNTTRGDAASIQLGLIHVEADLRHAQRLATFLAPQRYDGRIKLLQRDTGKTLDQLADELRSVDMVLVLLSVDLFASEEHMSLVESLVAAGRPRVVLISVRPTDTEAYPALRGLLSLPKGGVVIAHLADEDEGWLQVSRGLRRLVAPLMIRVLVEPAARPAPRTRDIQIVPQRVTGGSYRIGDKIRVSFQCDRDCQIMLINHGTSGKVSRFYPPGQAPLVRCDEDVSYYFPNASDEFDFVLGGPPGRETIRAVAIPLGVEPAKEELERALQGHYPAGWTEALVQFDVGS